MYSGTTLTKYSGRVLGAHQKFDRVARRQLGLLSSESGRFPKTRQILYFEGKNGPDGIKRKSPAKDEPWHYFSPFDEGDSALTSLIEDHYSLLVRELRAGNQERAAFEAAWLAHAIVDGLTPAHHYPYEKKLVELRGGKSIETRTTIREKLVMHGDTRSEKIKNNWKMWGPKGLITTHGLFEIGIAMLVAPLSFNQTLLKPSDLKRAKKVGATEWFRQAAREIAVLDMYERYYETGWNSRLAKEVRNKLAPTIIQSITVSWYLALEESGTS